MTAPVRIAVAGASGRMGRMLIEAVLRDPATELHAAFEREGSEFVGRDPGEFVGQTTTVRISSDVAAGLQGANWHPCRISQCARRELQGDYPIG